MSDSREVPDKKFNIQDWIDADARAKKEKRHLEIPFRGYLEMLETDPLVAQNSPARLLEVILETGEEPIPKAERFANADKRYKLFSTSLFGLERSIQNVVEHLKVGASSLSTGKQILLLVGPTASGKSTFVSTLKRALENYRTRPVFMIKGCPMFEEPLHLLPKGEVRDKMAKELGVKIEGDLCPVCRHRLLNEYRDKEGGVVRWWDMPVETFTFSIQGCRGIGSFEPSDKKTSDVTLLIGRENISITSVKGYNHPQSYELSGEAEKANRGLLECREMIKAQEEILWVFISAAEEKEIKVQGSTFPHLHVDLSIIGHTNLTEYKKFAGRPENEALHDRIYTVFFPYPVRIQDEVKIYRKLIEEESTYLRLKKCHIAPGALELAALFAVLTRLTDPPGDTDLLTKAKAYNGDVALTKLRDKDQKPLDIRLLLEEAQKDPDIAKREGMFGMSSRDILAALNNALVKEGENGCLTPLGSIQALRGVFDHRMGYSPEDVKSYREFLSAGEKDSVMVEYRDFILEAVTKAFLSAYSDLAKALFNRYIEEVQFYRDQKRKYTGGRQTEMKLDPKTGKPKEPDMKFMRSIEEQIELSDDEAETFRGELLEYKSSKTGFGYGSYPLLDMAVDRKLIADSTATLAAVLNSDKANTKDESRRVDDLFKGLQTGGFCNVCAQEAVEQAQEFLSQ